jgi:HSP20 family molecular chaperone IbpA
MAGVDKKDIAVNIDNGQLALSGLRKIETTGSAAWEEFGEVEFIRTFSVPQTIDIEKVNAEKLGIKNMVLEIAESDARMIDIDRRLKKELNKTEEKKS